MPNYMTAHFLCYQTTRGARFTARPLTPVQHLLLALCDERVIMLADLAKAAHLSIEDARQELTFLGVHGLVKIVPLRYKPSPVR